MAKEYLVFANYFNGWWRGETTKWATDGEDWRLRYPERIPIAGCYNGADTMRAEIDYASENGLCKRKWCGLLYHALVSQRRREISRYRGAERRHSRFYEQPELRKNVVYD